MMYVGSTDPLSESEIELVQDLAGAFSVAYARYEDFTKLEVAKEQAESALKELKTTQAQLIQSEKMASLGELTAGIAHEIQNPLNFVNNFSEVNAELAAEIKYELASGNTEQAIALVNAVLENEQKIAHHGKRAEAIVKSMLQHSRNTSGKKETKDINQLVDEYLRLSYHGFRAKEKEFSVIMETHFDKTAGEVNIIPEDIGRVLLNLFNNAFYSLFKKKQQTGGSFEPLLQVTTVKMNGTLNITVRDNGTGIPEAVLDKIFQPFFTTKPTGEGTGLGLSLSYDIVTKGHGGSIKADTREGVFTEFTISLPAK
jgi:C4-dicarboxylate-specific signal transduction histidine kinase